MTFEVFYNTATPSLIRPGNWPAEVVEYSIVKGKPVAWRHLSLSGEVIHPMGLEAVIASDAEATSPR